MIGRTVAALLLWLALPAAWAAERIHGADAHFASADVALEWAVLRMLSGEVPDPSASASALKLKGSSIQHEILDLAIAAMGPDMIPFYPDTEEGPGDNLPFWTPDEAPGLMAQYLYRRAGTIYAGTSEVQRGIIYKQLSRR